MNRIQEKQLQVCLAAGSQACMTDTSRRHYQTLTAHHLRYRLVNLHADRYRPFSTQLRR